jgi:TolB-like protein
MIYRFGTLEAYPERLELVDAGEPISVQPQVFALLIFLIENRDRVVTKDEVIESVWDGRAISDSTLNARINALRRALGDDGQKQAVVRTFPRRGFRFVAEVFEDIEASNTSEDFAHAPDAASNSIDRPSIAVLPFENLSRDPEQDYFSDGITEDIITALSHIRQFFVVARNSTFQYKGTSQDVRQVARDLGVRYILEGSVRKSANNIRISARLVDGETGNYIWADRYDRKFEDIFAIQDEITTTVVGAIQPELDHVEQMRSRNKSSSNLDAWDLYQRGMWHSWRDGEEDLVSARLYFQRAIELDPEFCLAHAFLACAIWRSVVFRFLPLSALDEARLAAERALTIDNTNAYAHWALGVVLLQLREHILATELFEYAIELNPSFAHALQWLGWTMVYDKQPEEGILKEQEAQRLSPNDPTDWGKILIQAQAKMNLKEFTDAENLARKAKRQANNLPVNCVILASAGYMGSTSGIDQILQEVFTIDPQFTARSIADVFPFKHQDDIDIWIDGLRKAGLPDC